MDTSGLANPAMRYRNTRGSVGVPGGRGVAADESSQLTPAAAFDDDDLTDDLTHTPATDNTHGDHDDDGNDSGNLSNDEDDENAEFDGTLIDKSERDRWSAPRKVINEAMIRKAVVDELATHYDDPDDIPKPEEIQLEEVTTLVLSFMSIDRINNLVGFENLIKLQLDNNCITKIENLDHLVNLEWLDLSFNMITVIEGLDNLTKLTDLSLYSNRIERIGNGLNNLVNLECLSLGHNLLSDTSELAVLRRFKRLRMITLKENQFPADEEYRNLALAHATELRYIDYEPVDAAKASEAKKMEINIEYEKREESEQKALEAMKAQLEERKRMQEAGLEPLLDLGARLVEKDELHARLIDDPAYREAWDQYMIKFESVVAEERKQFYKRYLIRKAAEATFQNALKKVIDGKEEELMNLIETFNHRYKLSIRSRQPEVIEACMQSVTELSDSLLELETLSLKQARKLMEEYMESCRKESQDWTQTLNALSRRLVDLDAEFTAQIRRQITAATSAAEGEEDAGDEKEGDAADAIEPNVVDSMDGSKRRQRPDAATMADNNAGLNMGLQGERESYTTLVTNAHDAHIMVIDRTEGILSDGEASRHAAQMEQLVRREQTRRRQRVMEIYTLCERYMTSLAKELEAAKAERSASATSGALAEPSTR